MAVENKWASELIEADKLESSLKSGAGGESYIYAETFEVAVADDNGSIYKLAQLPANAILQKIEINNDAITGATDYDLGLYKNNGVDQAIAIGKELLAANLNMSAAAARGSEKNGLAALNIDTIGQKVWELLGKTLDTKEEQYVLALTANTVGAAAGTISYRIRYIQG